MFSMLMDFYRYFMIMYVFMSVAMAMLLIMDMVMMVFVVMLMLLWQEYIKIAGFYATLVHSLINNFIIA